MQPESADQPCPAPLPPAEASLRNLPVNLFAAVMGLSGLALAWRFAHYKLGAPAIVGEAIGGFALVVFFLLSLGYLAKLARHADAARAEFHHPVAGNFFGTIGISVLLLSAVLEPYAAPAAQSVWTVGVVVTLLLAFVVVSRLLRGEVDASHALPAWLIPGVATLDVAVTGGHMPMGWAAEANLFAGAVGAVMALVLFAMIIRRLVHEARIAPAMEPSLMILVAPFAVGFLAYVNIAGTIDRFAGLLFYFALFMFAVVAPRVFRPGAKFSPGWWAIGFPLAALLNAALLYAESRESAPLRMLAIALLGFLSIALTVLTLRTARIVLNRQLFR